MSRATILFVTGKGGSGKSWISAGLAREAAARGLRSARVRVTAPSEADHQPGAGSSRGFEDIVVREREALADFLHEVIPLGFVARRLLDSETFSAVAAAAPGLRDLVALATVARLGQGSDAFDLVVVDAPASGHSVPMVTAPARVGEVVSFGRIARLVEDLDRLVRDNDRFRVLVVTTPEELSVIEAIDLSEELTAAGAPPARVVVNGLWPAYLDGVCARWLRRSGASGDALLHLGRRERQESLVARLQARVGPTSTIAQHFGEPEARERRREIAELFDELTAQRKSAA